MSWVELVYSYCQNEFVVVCAVSQWSTAYCTCIRLSAVAGIPKSGLRLESFSKCGSACVWFSIACGVWLSFCLRRCVFQVGSSSPTCDLCCSVRGLRGVVKKLLG